MTIYGPYRPPLLKCNQCGDSGVQNDKGTCIVCVLKLKENSLNTENMFRSIGFPQPRRDDDCMECGAPHDYEEIKAERDRLRALVSKGAAISDLNLLEAYVDKCEKNSFHAGDTFKFHTAEAERIRKFISKLRFQTLGFK